MAIKNFTTTINEHKTVGDIQGILARKGALNINIRYENGMPQAVAFIIKVGEFPVPFQLPCNFAGVRQAMLRDKQARSKAANFRNVAWRIVKDWVEAQMALVEAGQSQLAEVFLPYAVNQDGVTMFQSFIENQQRALPAPRGEK